MLFKEPHRIFGTCAFWSRFKEGVHLIEEVLHLLRLFLGALPFREPLEAMSMELLDVMEDHIGNDDQVTPYMSGGNRALIT